MIRYIITFLLTLIISKSYGQHEIVVSVDNVIKREMHDIDNSLGIVIDHIAYTLPITKENVFIIPKNVIAKISEVETFYFYLETNKRYYLSRNYRYTDISNICSLNFKGLSKTSNIKNVNVFITPFVFIPIKHKLKVAVIERRYCNSTSIEYTNATVYKKGW